MRRLLESKGEAPVTCTKLETVEEVLKAADVRCSPPSHPVLVCCPMRSCGRSCVFIPVTSTSHRKLP